MISATSALPGSKVALSERSSDDFRDVRFAGVKGRAVRTSAPMISTTYAFQGLEVKGQGSILASPALYKDEQNGARSQLWVGWQSGGVGEPSGARSLVSVLEDGARGSVGSVGGAVG